MSLIPTYGGTSVLGVAARNPGDTQIGCVWCLKAGVNAPTPGDIIYQWGGTSVCSTHMQAILDSQEPK